jgi:hypothetical protein
LDAHAASGLLLAFDDMHHLNQAPDLLSAIAAGVLRASDRVSFAIASREAAPSSWAPFVAGGRLAEIGFPPLYSSMRHRLVLDEGVQGGWG